MHSGNIGVIRDSEGDPSLRRIIRDSEGDPSLRRIDFGWGFSNLTREVHPHSRSKHLPGRGPTNHFREFPSSLKLTDEFAKGLDAAADTDVEPVLREAFETLQRFYDNTTLKKWAQHAMPDEFAKKSIDILK